MTWAACGLFASHKECGQTPPLEKCEQPDLKHPQAMLQNDICPQNSPRGEEGFASWPTDYNSLDTNSSKSGFFVNFLQVYRYFFCNEINSRSLLLWGFDNCEKKEPSKELNRICMLESCNFVL